MLTNATIHDVMQVRTIKHDAVHLIGFQGTDLDDQHALFKQLNETIDDIAGKKSDYPYLVIVMPGFHPYVGIEAAAAGTIPENMITYTIPEDEYVVFRFGKPYVGLFWSSICIEDNQAKYNIDLSKPRFEINTPELISDGMIEWYIPAKS